MHWPRASRRHIEHYANPDECFHLTINAHPKFANWPMPVREMIWKSVIEQTEAERVELFVASLMPDHLHLLLCPSGHDIVRFAQQWKSWTTRQSWELGNRSALWQRRFWDRTIRDDEDFQATAEYILRNPVAAGLVSEEHEWPYSWAAWWKS